ncbi:MAG: hypothetical protein ACON42_01310 [Flavobacteriaceae bacterium]
MKIDLHGKSHRESIRLVEDLLLDNSLVSTITETEIITGNSLVLQNKIIQEVLEHHGFKWYIPHWNKGMIVVLNH